MDYSARQFVAAEPGWTADGYPVIAWELTWNGEDRGCILCPVVCLGLMPSAKILRGPDGQEYDRESRKRVPDRSFDEYFQKAKT